MRILVTNQHTNNRGDESALRGMIYGLKKAFGNKQLKFMVMKQDETHPFLNEKGVKEMGMINSIKSLFFFNFLLLLSWLKLEKLINFFQGKTARKLKAYLKADLVISAPGGPYFGDLYANHEIVHLYHAWVAKFLGKPLVLYAPSAGPFEKKWFKPLRRFVLKKFDLIILRDPVSKKHIDKFIPEKKSYLTADSCLQQPIKPKAKKENKVGITLWGYQTQKNRQKKLEKYKKIMADYADYLVGEYKLKIVFLPQLFGKNSDVELIKSVINLMTHPAEIFPHIENSTQQQRFISSLKLVVGARYHGIIFSVKNRVPFIPIYYEHKTKGFVKMMGLEDFLIDINKLNLDLLKRKTKKLFKEKTRVKSQMATLAPLLQKRSLYSSLLTRECFYFLKDKNKGKIELDDFLFEKYKGDKIFRNLH